MAGTFAQITLAIFLEAAPFLLLGSLVGALFEVYVDRARLEALQPRNPLKAVAVGLLAGVALPVCECGVVPVARRFLARGLDGRLVLAYMLAAPVMNPVSMISTLIAYRGDAMVLAARLAMVLIPAGLMAWFFGAFRPEVLLRPEASGHEHGHGCGCRECGSGSGEKRGFWDVLGLTASEFMAMGKYLFLGCIAAAAVKTFLPWEVLSLLEDSPLLAVAGMMLMAVLLSVCSEADAFVAAGFSFAPMAGQLAFMALGPMLDLKLIAMFGATFRGPLFRALLFIPPLLVGALALLAGLLWPEIS